MFSSKSYGSWLSFSLADGGRTKLIEPLLNVQNVNNNKINKLYSFSWSFPIVYGGHFGRLLNLCIWIPNTEECLSANSKANKVNPSLALPSSWPPHKHYSLCCMYILCYLRDIHLFRHRRIFWDSHDNSRSKYKYIWNTIMLWACMLWRTHKFVFLAVHLSIR